MIGNKSDLESQREVATFDESFYYIWWPIASRGCKSFRESSWESLARMPFMAEDYMSTVFNSFVSCPAYIYRVIRHQLDVLLAVFKKWKGMRLLSNFKNFSVLCYLLLLAWEVAPLIGMLKIMFLIYLSGVECALRWNDNGSWKYQPMKPKLWRMSDDLWSSWWEARP